MLIGIPTEEECGKSLFGYLKACEDDDFKIQIGIEGVDVILTCRAPEVAYTTTTLLVRGDAMYMGDVDFDKVTRVLLLSAHGHERMTPDQRMKVVVLPQVTGPDSLTSWKNYLKRFRGAPGLVEQGTNFTKSVVKHAAGGFEKATAEEQERRLAICDTCEHRSPDWKCMQCGCPLKKKSSWAHEKCPIGKWEETNMMPPPAPLNVNQPEMVGCGACGQ